MGPTDNKEELIHTQVTDSSNLGSIYRINVFETPSLNPPVDLGAESNAAFLQDGISKSIREFSTINSPHSADNR